MGSILWEPIDGIIDQSKVTSETVPPFLEATSNFTYSLIPFDEVSTIFFLEF